MSNRHIGSSLDDLLAADGTLGESTTVALKRVLAWQIVEAMRREGLSKTDMARRMGTSRAALERLLDPENTSLTLRTLDRAAAALGRRLAVELVDASR